MSGITWNGKALEIEDCSQDLQLQLGTLPPRPAPSIDARDRAVALYSAHQTTIEANVIGALTEHLERTGPRSEPVAPSPREQLALYGADESGLQQELFGSRAGGWAGPPSLLSRFRFSLLVILPPQGDVVVLGLAGDCDWDEDPSLGVLLHGVEVVEIGSRELLWRPH